MSKLLPAMLAFSMLVSSTLGFARKHHASHPELCRLRSVFVKGNSESADDVRAQLSKRTWLSLATSTKSADAVMVISEKRSEKNFPIRTERTTVSAEISKADGSLLWSGSANFDEGVFNSGAGSAAKILLSHLESDAGCPR